MITHCYRTGGWDGGRAGRWAGEEVSERTGLRMGERHEQGGSRDEGRSDACPAARMSFETPVAMFLQFQRESNENKQRVDAAA